MDMMKKAAAPEAQEKESPSADPEALVSEIQSKLGELKGLVGEASPEDQETLESAIQSFESFVSSMNQEAGAEAPKPKFTGRVPLEAGNKKIKPAY